MDRNLKILAALACVLLIAVLGLLALALNDLRRTVSAVDGAVRQIARVEGVQETVSGQLAGLADLVDDDGNASGDGADEEADGDGQAMPGRPSVSARTLWQDFQANQVRAYEKYESPRIWAVSGTVDSVAYGDSGYIYVGLNNVVRVRFRRDYEREWLDEIDKGQRLWFECAVEGQDEDGFVICVSPND